MKKVLLINGSPNEHGNTDTALREVAASLNANGIATELLWLGKKPMPDCIACGQCRQRGSCVFDDAVNAVNARLDEFGGFIVGSPVYYGGPTGRLTATLDIRQPVTFTGEDVLARIQGALQGSGVEASTRSYSKPLYLSCDHPLVQTLLSTYREMTGDDAPPLSMGGGTYARSMDNCVAFGAEALPGETSGGMHEAGEHLALRDFYLSGHIFLHALAALAGQNA